MSESNHVETCWNYVYSLTPIQLLSISSSEAETWGSGSNVFSASPFEWHRLFHHWFHQRKKNPAVQCKTCRTWIVIDIIIDMSLSRIATIKREKRVITHNTRFNSFSMHNAFHLHSINMKIISPFLTLAQNCSSRSSQTNQKIQCMNITIVYVYNARLYINIISICFAFYYLTRFFPLCFSVFFVRLFFDWGWDSSGTAAACCSSACVMLLQPSPCWGWMMPVSEKNVVETSTYFYKKTSLKLQLAATFSQETLVFFFNPLWYDRFRVKSVGGSKGFRRSLRSIVSWHLHELRILHDLWT